MQPGTPSFYEGTHESVSISIVGNVGQPPWLQKGMEAHNIFTTYMRAQDPTESQWKANKSIGGANNLSRPDLVYDNGNIGGVWELKPAAPSGSAPLAIKEAAEYSAMLNLYYGTDKFAPGSLNGAPSPITGKLLLPSITGSVFEYTMPNAFDGAIYWKEIKPDKKPQPDYDWIFRREPKLSPNNELIKKIIPIIIGTILGRSLPKSPVPAP